MSYAKVDRPRKPYLHPYLNNLCLSPYVPETQEESEHLRCNGCWCSLMSSIGQSILMALTVTVNRFASSNVQAVHRRERKRPTTTTTDIGRRGLLLSTVVAATQITDSRTEILKSIKYFLSSTSSIVLFFFFGFISRLPMYLLFAFFSFG